MFYVMPAFDCDSLNVDFKGSNEMICWQALYKRPKRLHYEFLPDFLFDHPGSITNLNYFSFSGFLASRLSFTFSLFSWFRWFWNHILIQEIWGTKSDQYKEWFKSICMPSLLRRHLFELVTRLASYADVLRARHAFVISVSASSLISLGASVSKIGTIIQFRQIWSLLIKSIALIISKIDNYRLLTKKSFIDFYRISKKLIDFYRLLSNVIDIIDWLPRVYKEKLDKSSTEIFVKLCLLIVYIMGT